MSRRVLGPAVAVAVLAATVGAVTPAGAANPARLIDDAVRALKPLPPRAVRLPRVRLAPSTAVRYGVSDPVAAARLDDAKSLAVQNVDSGASAVESQAGSNSVAASTKRCAQNAFKETAADYYADAEAGEPYRLFGNVYYYAIRGCLATAFPHAADGSLDRLAAYLTGRVSLPASSAANAAPSAFANWLDATGDELGGETAQATVPDYTPPPGPVSGDDTGGGDGGSGFPWWVVAVLGIFGGIWLIAHQAGKKST